MSSPILIVFKGKKSVVVLDGIESVDALELVRLAFKVSSKDKISSKILVTTRMREIGEICCC